METWEGVGRVAGFTRIEGVNTEGVGVDCLHRRTGRIVRSTVSAAGGAFEFNGLNSADVFDVIARPIGKNAVISDSRKPVSGGVYHSKWDELRRDPTHTVIDGMTASAYMAYLVNSELTVSSGKWYWEITVQTASSQNALMIGVGRPDELQWGSPTPYGLLGYFSYDGKKYEQNTSSAYGEPFNAGDVISVILDMDAGTLAFRRNGVSFGVAFSGLSGTYGACISDGSNVLPMSASVANFGQSGFLYPVPTGFNPGLYLT